MSTTKPAVSVQTEQGLVTATALGNSGSGHYALAVDGVRVGALIRTGRQRYLTRQDNAPRMLIAGTYSGLLERAAVEVALASLSWKH
jgi:hypothetical protein